MCSARQAAVIAATFAVLATAQPAAAETCLRMVVSASGSTSMWNKEELARTSAIAAWPAAASETAGADYASWGAARGKTVACALATKSTVRCTAKATPCKP
ncbi:hypothetical protein DB459_14245 [Bradyrhizobium sp. WD16]|nr:hypothetical protein DB459_14245 [Bradyrhizobium sp. WD16]